MTSSRKNRKWIIFGIYPGRDVKTESHGEKYWSKVVCKCGTLMDGQRWANGFYRITCGNCGHAFVSLQYDGLADFNGQVGENL